ncbi:MAG TPA: response regulator transcription factor [Opitutaceae bacterium]|nr:response regulator transcription factor [Opitutaceae bacterium]
MNVLVIEDQTMVRELLVIACQQILPSASVSTSANAVEALEACRRSPPELILLDLVLPGRDGLDLLKDLLILAPKAKVIVLSSYIDEFTLHRVQDSGVNGLLDKNEQSVKVLAEAITAVLDGRRYISSSVQQMWSFIRADPIAFDKILSEREQEVLRLVGAGLTNEKIAQQLEISTLTARNHRLNIMGKLGLHSTPELIRYAMEKGFTRIPERKTKSSR